MEVEHFEQTGINFVIKSKQHKQSVVAIVLAEGWFEKLYKENKIPYFISKTDYVVCSWFDFSDGIKSNIEGLRTLAICKNKQDAELIYNNHNHE